MRIQDARLTLEPGSRISRYEVVSELGRGGMGIVYRARDLELGRDVALKQPWPALAENPLIRKRFQREAKAASRLLHPNIVPVFEVFEERGLDWLVLELIEGQSLRQRIKASGPLSVDETLKHAEGLADALRLAHDGGILHRDINTNNILLDGSGRARLTDFGLVQFFVPEGADSVLSTISTSLTEEGATVGTLAYMAPEQALGKPLDPRSDLYSLGAVLYEMCTGRPVVEKREHGAVIDAILNHEPTPIARLNYAVPEELERIVRKCLRKRPDERYQTSRDLLVDLRALRRERDRPEPVPVRWPRWVAIAALLAAAGVVAWLALRERQDALPTAQAHQVTAAPGWEAEAAISPDGGLIAYVSDESGHPDLWLIDARGGNPLQLTDDPATDRSPAWMPDGSSIVFASDRSGQNAIWKVPRLGGAPTMVVPRGLDPAPSPDGQRLAFARPGASGGLRIAVIAFDAPEQVGVLTGDDDGLWDHRYPAWSRDGRTLCYADWRHLWLIPVSGGPARQLTFDGLADSEPAWSADGRHVYFSSAREGTTALWRVAARGGAPLRVTLGTGPERRPSVAPDGSRLAYSTLVEDPDLIVVDLATGRRQRLSAMGVELNAGLAPDGAEVAFVSNRWGQLALWAQRLVDGRPDGTPRRLTDHPGTANNPDFSPDGRFIAYHRVLDEQRDIWIMPATGGQPRKFTEHPGIDIQPAWSPDGSLIAFSSNRDGASGVWVKPVIDGESAGPARRVATGPFTVEAPAWSPSGDRIAFVGLQEDRGDIYVVPADGSAPPRRVTDGARAAHVAWEKSSGMLLVSGWWDTGRLALRRVPPSGGAGQPLDPPIEFGPVAWLGDFDLSADGSLLVYTREEVRGDIWVMESASGSF